MVQFRRFARLQKQGRKDEGAYSVTVANLNKLEGVDLEPDFIFIRAPQASSPHRTDL